MFERLPQPGRPLAKILASVAFHWAFIALLLHQPRPEILRVTLPGTLQGSRVELNYVPGRAPSPSISQHPDLKPADTPVARIKSIDRATPPVAPPAATLIPPPPRPHLRVIENTAPLTNAPASTTPNSLTGSDSWGNGSIQIALTTYSPSPKPDLSHLPHGTQGDVVLDVTIDPTGKVADLEILHALGYGIDDTVVSTVRTWTFHPATKDGVPVASIQELHFHYGPA